MNVACLFPGLNAISRERDRARYFHLPEVACHLDLLRQRGYGRWLDLPARALYEDGDFAALATITMAIQTGVFERLRQQGLQADILVGCSLGDVSRTVCSGAIDFEQAVEVTESFRTLVEAGGDQGSTRSVRLPARQSVDDQLLQQLVDIGLQPSVLSNRHFIVGCDERSAQQLDQLARTSGWKVTVSPFPYALHSRHLKAGVDELSRHYDLNLRTPSIPVFSAVQLKVLHSAEALNDDALRCFYQPVQWVNSLRALLGMGVSRFINIGPCMSLPLLLRETRLGIKMESV